MRLSTVVYLIRNERLYAGTQVADRDVIGCKRGDHDAALLSNHAEYPSANMQLTSRPGELVQETRPFSRACADTAEKIEFHVHAAGVATIGSHPEYYAAQQPPWRKTPK
jgi:hypothetical protein